MRVIFEHYIMHFSLTVVIFLVVVFLYLHIIQEYTKSEDLEVYEMDYQTREHFQEVCSVKQPFLFEFLTQAPEVFDSMTLTEIGAQTEDEIHVFDTKDYIENTESVDFISLPFRSAAKLIETDPHAHFFSEQNHVFLEENGFHKKLETLNPFFKPAFGTIRTRYDLLFGSKKANTPLRYHTHSRHLLCVSQGKIRVKMTPWKSSKYLFPIKDYVNYEFRSAIDVWRPLSKYGHEMDKLKFLEFDVFSGHVLNVPAYWWYSIQYSNDPTTTVFSYTYDTVINRLAHSHDICMYLLQQQNMVRKIVKPLESNVVGLETEPEKTGTDLDKGLDKGLDKDTGLKTETTNVQSLSVVDDPPPPMVATL